MAGVYRRESAWSISDLPLGGAPDESAGSGLNFTDIFDLWLIWLSAAVALCCGQMGAHRVDQDLGDGVGALWGAGQCDLSGCC